MLHVVYVENDGNPVAETETDTDVFGLHVGDDVDVETEGRSERYVVGAVGPTHLEGDHLVARVAVRPAIAA